MLGDIKTLEDLEFLMSMVYAMNPDMSEEEIDERIHRGVQEVEVA